MKARIKIVIAASIFLAMVACLCGRKGHTGPAVAQPESEMQKFSYALGLEVGESMRPFASEIDLDYIAAGLSDGIEKKEAKMAPEEAAAVKREVFGRVQQEQAEKTKEAGGKNIAAQDSFLAQNKAEKDVVTTASGLQYKVLKAGAGPKPKATDAVKVHYKGTLLDGTEFDNSYTRGEPVTFPVNQVIPGWSEGLQLMNTGGKYQLWIPSKLAYGERGAGQQIGPNALLVFEVELQEIVAQKTVQN
jgi:FKBP-type peptidyl-prolyl cis-trans isomerase